MLEVLQMEVIFHRAWKVLDDHSKVIFPETFVKVVSYHQVVFTTT